MPVKRMNEPEAKRYREKEPSFGIWTIVLAAGTMISSKNLWDLTGLQFLSSTGGSETSRSKVL